MRRFQIAVSFFSFSSASPTSAPSTRRATPWVPKARVHLNCTPSAASCFLSRISGWRDRSLILGVAGSRIWRRWRAGSCPSLRPRRRRFLFPVRGWWPALLVCAIRVPLWFLVSSCARGRRLGRRFRSGGAGAIGSAAARPDRNRWPRGGCTTTPGAHAFRVLCAVLWSDAVGPTMRWRSTSRHRQTSRSVQQQRTSRP
jgi:hypothetical protein